MRLDLAMLKIEAKGCQRFPQRLQQAAASDVFAFGSPEGLQDSVTMAWLVRATPA